jgi:hypothetical protein
VLWGYRFVNLLNFKHSASEYKIDYSAFNAVYKVGCSRNLFESLNLFREISHQKIPLNLLSLKRRGHKAQETKSTKEIPLKLKPFLKMLLFGKPLYFKVKMDSRSQKEREEEGAELSEVPPTSSSLGHSISCIPGL